MNSRLSISAARVGLFIGGGGLGLLFLMRGMAPSLGIAIDPTMVTAEGGHSFSVGLEGLVRFPYRIEADSSTDRFVSRLAVHEGGRPLGPAHSLHDTIRTIGRGAYSHRQDQVIFSTTDNSDPRANGRAYKIAVSARLDRWIEAAIFIVSAGGFTVAGTAYARAGLRARRGGSRTRWRGLMSRALGLDAEPRVRIRAFLLGVLLLVLLVWAQTIAPVVTLGIAPSQIQAPDGHAYSAVPENPPDWPYEVPSDVRNDDHRSGLILFENGVPLGPSHAMYRTIAEAGRGAYSHWGGLILFSTVDGSDPRSNGRRYHAEARAALPGVLWLVAGTLLAVVTASAFPVGICRLFRFACLPAPGAQLPPAIAACLILMSAATCGWVAWFWMSDQGPMLSLAGYLPLSDALGYETCAAQILGRGDILDNPGFCTRRILYPGLLAGLLLIMDWSWGGALLAQAAAVGVALALLMIALARATGLLGAAIAVAVLLVFAGEYVLSVYMTEVAGFVFGLAALTIFLGVTSPRMGGVAILGLALLSLAMVARVGALFSLAAVALVMAKTLSGDDTSRRWRWLACVAGGLSCGFMAQTVILLALNLPTEGTFGNFATVLYRLSIGAENWQQAYADYGELLTGTDAVAGFNQLYAITIDNILAEPAVFAASLRDALRTYFLTLFAFGSAERYTQILEVLLLAGIADCLWAWREPGRRLLIAAALGEVASAPFIVEDGGLRIFAATVGVRAVLVAYGVALLGRMLWYATRSQPGTQASTAMSMESASRAGEMLSRATVGLGLILLIIVALPLTPIGALARWQPLRGQGCASDEFEIVANTERESQYLLLVEEGRAMVWPPARANISAVRNAIAGTWYEQSVRRLDAPIILLHAVQRGPNEFGRIHPVILAGEPLAGLGGLLSICVRASAMTEIAGTPYFRGLSIASISRVPDN